MTVRTGMAEKTEMIMPSRMSTWAVMLRGMSTLLPLAGRRFGRQVSVDDKRLEGRAQGILKTVETSWWGAIQHARRRFFGLAGLAISQAVSIMDGRCWMLGLVVPSEQKVRRR
jgi:hypothetical protein